MKFGLNVKENLSVNVKVNPRFIGENLAENIKIIEKFQTLAKDYGLSAAGLAIACGLWTIWKSESD